MNHILALQKDHWSMVNGETLLYYGNDCFATVCIG